MELQESQPKYSMQASRRRKRRIRSVVKRTILKFISRSNTYIIQRLPDWFEAFEPRVEKLRDNWIAWGRKGNEADQVRMVFLLSMVENLKERKISGAFAELGVFQGHTAKLFNQLDPDRELYLFDTFEGFSQKDLEMEVSTSEQHQFKKTSLDLVRKFLGDSNKIKFFPGYFPESAKAVTGDSAFALVHLDCDLYAPMVEGLKYFYPRLKPGGAMIIHDYQNVASWPGVKKAVDEFLADKPERLILIPDASGTAAFVKSVI